MRSFANAAGSSDCPPICDLASGEKGNGEFEMRPDGTIVELAFFRRYPRHQYWKVGKPSWFYRLLKPKNQIRMGEPMVRSNNPGALDFIEMDAYEVK